MICKVCGSEFNIENFDVCPYCLTPVKNMNDTDKNGFEKAVISDCSSEDNYNKGEEHIESASTDYFSLYDNYEVTEEDLIDPSDEKEQEVLIDELGLSVRAVNAFKRARIYTLNELIVFLANNSVADLKNVGEKTIRETDNLIEKIRTGKFEKISSTSKEKMIEEDYVFENISPDVDYLSIDALAELGLTKKTVLSLKNSNVRCCEGLRKLSKKELVRILGSRNMVKLPTVVELLEKDIVSLLNYVLDKNRGGREYDVILRRAQGETLQEIALEPIKEEYSVITRERVRQLENKYLRRILPFVRELLYILKGSNNYVNVQDVLDIFDDDEYDLVILYASKVIDEFEYLDFAEMFVDRNKEFSIEQRLLGLIKEIVDNGMDIYENREQIEEVLVENRFDYLNIESIVSLLKKYNYKFYGTFAVKGKSNYSTICMNMVRKYFPDGIKLSQESEKSEDLIRLRKIIEDKNYGLSLPPSDRTLSATLARSGLILRGRGIYIPQENVTVDESLLLEIKKYIDDMENNKVFYNEIYSEFEGALNVLCGIDNHNYLHGVLAMQYPDSYEYGRDYLIKNGAVDTRADSISDRIYSFICEKGRPVSKNELFQEFRGFSYVMLTMPFLNDPRLLQWEYSYYACMGIFDITNQDRFELKECIVDLFNKNNGYVSDGLLYEKVMEKYPEFIKKNGIKSEMNLHYIVAKMFSEEMDFRRPHISEKNNIDLSTTKNVALYLLNDPKCFTYEEYNGLCDRMKWSHVTSNAAFSEIEGEYDRISVNEYVKKNMFSVPDNIVDSVRTLIEENFENDILPLMSVDLDEFPEWEYPWNEFIVETIIRKYLVEFDVIQPAIKDRRFQKGIIVKKELKITSYSQVVARKMIATQNEKMTESKFLSFLVVHNLTRKVIPNELVNSDYVKKEGDYYCVVKE